MLRHVRRAVSAADAHVGRRDVPAAAEHLRRTTKARSRFRANLRRAEAWWTALGLFVAGDTLLVTVETYPTLEQRLVQLRAIEAALEATPLMSELVGRRDIKPEKFERHVWGGSA